MAPKEVFLSHSDTDRDFALRVSETLGCHGIPVWYSRTNILAAQQWHDEIGAALERCDWFLLLLTPRAVGSTWVKRELLFALSEPRFEGRIIPALFEPCDYKRLSWTLAGFQHVDFVNASYDDACRELLRVWRVGYRPV